MCVINESKKIITKFEGLHLKPYLCPAGVRTVGYGSTVAVSGEITPQEAENRLTNDINNCVKIIDRNIHVPLNDNQKAALISFVFNIGGGAFQRSTLRQKLNRGEYQNASKEFLRWDKVKGKRLRGLTQRREYEMRVFNTKFVEPNVFKKNTTTKTATFNNNILKKIAAGVVGWFKLV